MVGVGAIEGLWFESYLESQTRVARLCPIRVA
jgi:hypothetical protein